MNKKQLIIELAMPIVFAPISIYIIAAIPMEGEEFSGLCRRVFSLIL